MTAKLCETCGTDISHRHYHAVYCFPCSEERARKRAAKKSAPLCRRCRKPKEGRNEWYCESCQNSVRQVQRHWMENSGVMDAANLVAHAKKHGLIPDLRHEYIICRDCGNRAVEYDHRDYQYPLLIDPVCRSCNVRRGSAKPKRDYAPLDA